MAGRHETSESVARNHIFYLAKFFEKEQYAIDFMNGQLYANRLSFFKGLEEGDSANRGDKHTKELLYGDSQEKSELR